MTGRKDPLDYAFPQPPWMRDSSQILYGTRRFFWTSIWGLGWPPSMASCGAPARSCGWVERIERNREIEIGRRRSRVP
jgi:hypothetical protein